MLSDDEKHKHMQIIPSDILLKIRKNDDYYWS